MLGFNADELQLLKATFKVFRAQLGDELAPDSEEMRQAENLDWLIKIVEFGIANKIEIDANIDLADLDSGLSAIFNDQVRKLIVAA